MKPSNVRLHPASEEFSGEYPVISDVVYIAYTPTGLLIVQCDGTEYFYSNGLYKSYQVIPEDEEY